MSAQNCGSAPARPYDGEKELERISGLAELVEPFALSDDLAIDPDQEGVFVRTNLREGREGLLLEWGAEWPASWKTSPVFVVTLHLKKGRIKERKLGPFRARAGSLVQPLSLTPQGLFFGEGTDIGLAVKNNEKAAATAAGYVRGITWNEKNARCVRALLWQGGLVRPWPAGSVFDGP